MEIASSRPNLSLFWNHVFNSNPTSCWYKYHRQLLLISFISQTPLQSPILSFHTSDLQKP
ncbi:hypothetical protein LINGRAHAP2_LOCUS32768 [Linum grandiflorum]